MARPLQIEFVGVLYHVTSRGNERKPIYRDDHDRARFLERLAPVVTTHRLRVLAFAPITSGLSCSAASCPSHQRRPTPSLFLRTPACSQPPVSDKRSRRRSATWAGVHFKRGLPAIRPQRPGDGSVLHGWRDSGKPYTFGEAVTICYRAVQEDS